MSQKLNRRKFLERSSLGFLGAGIISGPSKFNSLQKEDSIDKPSVKEYRTLGRTGFKVSDISSGTPANEATLKACLDSGVNLIDTGEAYANGNNERLIAKVITDYDRSSLFINTKLYEEKKFKSKEDVIERTNKSLERLGVEYVDCMMIHSAESSEIIKDEAFHAGMKQMKKEGKVRYVGVSCHGNNHLDSPKENLEKVLMTAIEDGRFDVILLAYNFVNAEMAERVLDACEKNNIGTIIMKSNPVQIYQSLDAKMKKIEESGKEPDEYTSKFFEKYKKMNENAHEFFEQYGVVSDEEMMSAATKYVLSNPKAHTIIWAFTNFNDVKNVLALSGQKLSKKEDFTLNHYRKSFGDLTCRIGCNDCEAACPHQVPVNKIMRYNYYFEVKNQQRDAMLKYAKLPGGKPHEVCLDCPGFCEDACSYGVKTQAILASAHHNLGWSV
jgi:uncharacterized protein